MLLVVRATDLPRKHPDADWSHVCSRFNEPVGIYPSGQRVLATHPDTVIVCSVCENGSGVAAQPLPGVVKEIFESIPNPLSRKPS